MTGSKVSTNIQERLLDPLDIHGMILDFREPIPPDFEIAHDWYDTDGDGVLEDISSNSRIWLASLSRILYYTRAEDFARWSHALFHEKRVLNQASLDEMLDFHSPTPGEPLVAGYGLGAWTPKADVFEGMNLLAYGHGGSIPGYRASMLYLPEYGVSTAIFINDDVDEGFGHIIGALMKVLVSQEGSLAPNRAAGSPISKLTTPWGESKDRK